MSAMNKNNNAHYSRASILKTRIDIMLIGAYARMKSRVILLVVIHETHGIGDLQRSKRTGDCRR